MTIYTKLLTPSQTPTPTPVFLGFSNADQPGVASSSSNSSTSSSTPGQVYINFDVFPSGAPVPTGTAITNQYPPAVFSSDSLHYPIADNQFWNNSRPNLLGRAPRFAPYNGTGYAPLYVDFATPVNDLKFYIVAVDEFRRGIAQINIYQNHQLTATRQIDGLGFVIFPQTVNVGAWGFNNVTGIAVEYINDINGVGFDDFSFTLAPTPSPTPTPQATPLAPGSLSASVTDRQVRLNWTGSSAAAGYYVKRATNNGGPYTTLAAPQDSSYLDPTPAGDKTYFYVVSAFNNGGQSVNSNQVSVSIPSACGDQPGITQSPGHIHSISGWDMTVEVSANDGVVLKDVSLNGRYMARSISFPYFTVATSKTQGVIRGELKPNSTDSTLRSRLVKLETDGGGLDAAFQGGGIAIDADYVIDRISATSDSCLHVTQHYFFSGKQLTKLFNGGRSCEPSGTVPCEMYNPWVSYQFESRNDEALLSFNAIQRNQFWVGGDPINSVGLFRDCGLTGPCTINLDVRNMTASAFVRLENPLKTEFKERVISGGQDTGQWDNIHETDEDKIHELPGVTRSANASLFRVSGGCPECVHMHWRWGTSVPARGYGDGTLSFFYSNTNQDMDVAIVKYRSQEADADYTTLADNEPIRQGANTGDQVVVYYSATGHRQNDLFFRHLYFFNPDFGGGTKTIQRTSGSNSGTQPPPSQDGPTSVYFPHTYQEGTVSFTEFDPDLVGQLPQGYAAYNNVGYNITTDAEGSGPYSITFGVPSAADQNDFNSLRILHAEPDPLDPDTGIWVDRTILAPIPKRPTLVERPLTRRSTIWPGL